MRELTAKQQRFVDEYLIDLNATQAAIRSGYSARTAGKIGPQLLGKTGVRTAIRARQEVLQEKIGVRQERVLAALAAIAFADMAITWNLMTRVAICGLLRRCRERSEWPSWTPGNSATGSSFDCTASCRHWTCWHAIWACTAPADRRVYQFSVL